MRENSALFLSSDITKLYKIFFVMEGGGRCMDSFSKLVGEEIKSLIGLNLTLTYYLGWEIGRR